MARHGTSLATVLQSPIGRLAALAVVGGIGCFAVTGGSVGARASSPAAASTTIRGERAGVAAGLHRGRHHGTRPAHPRHPAAPASAAAHPARRSAARDHRTHPASATRWLPTGTGMWIHEWQRTEGGRAAAVVRRARHVGLSTLYVRTGSEPTGFDGGPVLRGLVPAAHRAGIHVVAWDFPTLAHPVSDAHRLAKAARYGGAGTRVDAVAPDIETSAEGTHLTKQRVRAYLAALRRFLPAKAAILATVPWPSSQRVGRYPYPLVAGHADALIPMDYWYNNRPAAVTRASVHYLRPLGKPVLPVGQGYDSKVDVSWLPHSHQTKELAGFFGAARGEHLRAVSLWSWQTAGKAQWHALRKARHAFGR